MVTGAASTGARVTRPAGANAVIPLQDDAVIRKDEAGSSRGTRESPARPTTTRAASGTLPGMRTWTASTTAQAPSQDILDVLTDPEACARWAPIAFEVDTVGGRRLRGGSRARVSGRLAGRRVGFDVEVHEVAEHGLRLSADGPVGFDVRYDLADAVGGSEVHASVSVRPGRGPPAPGRGDACAALRGGAADRGDADRARAPRPPEAQVPPSPGASDGGAAARVLGDSSSPARRPPCSRCGTASEVRPSAWRELAGDDPDLVRVALRELRQHLQVLVAEQLGSGSPVVDRLEDGVDRLRLALGAQDRRLLGALGLEHRRLLLALGGEDLRTA